MKIKILLVALGIIVIAGLGCYALFNTNLQSNTKDLKENVKSLSRTKLPDTPLVYETDAESVRHRDKASIHFVFEIFHKGNARGYTFMGRNSIGLIYHSQVQWSAL